MYYNIIIKLVDKLMFLYVFNTYDNIYMLIIY